MKQEAIIKAVAELDGWKHDKRFTGEDYAVKEDDAMPYNSMKYLTSRDAIVPLREKLVNTQVLKDKWMEMAVMVILETEKEVDEYALTHLTAAQESKTLLLLLNKWIA